MKYLYASILLNRNIDYDY
jgi:hypothetical protein